MILFLIAMEMGSFPLFFQEDVTGFALFQKRDKKLVESEPA